MQVAIGLRACKLIQRQADRQRSGERLNLAWSGLSKLQKPPFPPLTHPLQENHIYFKATLLRPIQNSSNN